MITAPGTIITSLLCWTKIGEYVAGSTVPKAVAGNPPLIFAVSLAETGELGELT